MMGYERLSHGWFGPLQAGPETIGVPTAVIAWLVVVLGSLLVAALGVILGQSLWRYYRTRQREAVRTPIRESILNRTYAADPAWNDWVATLSARERSVAEEELDRLLRTVSGDETAVLADLAAALEIPERAREAVLHGDRYDRLDGLTWLTLLEQPLAPGVLEEHCTDTADERAAAARLLLASDHPQAMPVGLDLLYADCDAPLSVFGLDTLYRLAEHDPAAVIDRTIAEGIDWDDQVLVQTLIVVAELGAGNDRTDVSWLTTLLDHESPAVRAGTARALARYGWQDPLRRRFDPQGLVTDPDPEVRAAAYEMLGAWGDADALETLVAAAGSEPDDHARARAARALCDHPEAIPSSPPGPLARALRWTAASRNVRVRAGATAVRDPVPREQLPAVDDTADSDGEGFEWGVVDA